MKHKKTVITENNWIRLIDRYQYSIPKRKYAGIYYIRNVVDGKGYIGLTHDLHARLGSHMHIIRYKDLYINKNEEYQKDSMVLNAHRQFWNFNIEDIEFCILFMVEKSSLSRKELDKLLSDKEKYYISLYDTKENGYNMNGGGIDGIRTLTRESYKRICLANKRKATNGDNIVYCYDIKTQERTYFISNYAFRNFLGMSVENDCLHKYTIIKKQYLAARSVDVLEDKIQEYYSHFDINGVYHQFMPTDDMLRDICKYISEDEYNKKYNQKATYRSYSTFINRCKIFLTDDMREYVLRETDAGTFNIKTMMTVYPLDRKTAKKYQEQSIKDGWSYINKKKEDNTYIDSSKYIFTGLRNSPYYYFMYRYNHTLEETQSHFNITDRDSKITYENYNNIYYERFKRMFIDNIYILRYTDIHPIERKDESAYKFIDIDSLNNAYDDMVSEDNQEIISVENKTQKFPLNTWINFTDRYNYHISTDGVPGVFYIRNKVDKRGYIFYSHDLYSNVAYHTSIIASKQSYINCSEEQLEGNDIMQWHRKIWEFDFEDIEMCLLFEIENSHQMSRSDIEDILLKKQYEFIKQYDTINNGYNCFSVATNLIYCFDTETKKIMTFKSAAELSNYLNMQVKSRQYMNNVTLVCFNRYLISRTRENLAEKIKTYYYHCDPNGVYHVEYPTDDIIRDFFRGISKDDFVDKYNMGEATFYKYRKWFNISFFHLTEDIREYILMNSETVSENDLFERYGINKRLASSYIETTLKDGWFYIERQKSLGTYEDSRDLFMYASRREITVYDYFLKRLASSAEDIKDAYGLDRKTMIEFEKFNELNYDRLKSLYIDEKYPYNYWVCHEEMLNDIIIDMWLNK